MVFGTDSAKMGRSRLNSTTQGSLSYIIVSPFLCAVSFGRILMRVTQIAFISDGMIKRERRKEKLALCCQRSLSVLIRRVVFGESTFRTWVHDELVPGPERAMPTCAHRHIFSTPLEITDLFF